MTRHQSIQYIEPLSENDSEVRVCKACTCRIAYHVHYKGLGQRVVRLVLRVDELSDPSSPKTEQILQMCRKIVRMA